MSERPLVYRCVGLTEGASCNGQGVGLKEVYHLCEGNLQDIVEGDLLEGMGISTPFHMHSLLPSILTPTAGSLLLPHVFLKDSHQH
jgi:hypothetical protein